MEGGKREDGDRTGGGGSGKTIMERGGKEGNRRERINSMGKDLGNVWVCIGVGEKWKERIARKEELEKGGGKFGL
jgi:hypothetical protein